jgi:hypothetical protein
MSYEVLKSYIDVQIDKAIEKSTVARFRHHRTALNNLLKYSLANPVDLPVVLTSKLDETLSAYKTILVNKNKSDTRSPLSKLRRLAELYVELTDIDFSKQTFTDIVQAALSKMYGEKLYTGEITPLTQKKITDEFLTYRSIAKNLIRKSKEIDKSLWTIVEDDMTKSMPNGLHSASNKLRKFFSGEELPSKKYPLQRIHFLEHELGIPSGTLENKIASKSIAPSLTVRSSSKLKSNSKGKKGRNDTICLNDNLMKCLQEYREFKLYETQPELINVTDEMRRNRRISRRLLVTEKLEKKWTLNNKQLCNAAVRLNGALTGFLTFCCEDKKIPYETVSTYHLTDPDLVKAYCLKKINSSGASTAESLLQFLKLSCGKHGYLYYCGERGERSFEDFYDDVEYIAETSLKLIMKCRASVKKNQKFDSGKKNIATLLAIPTKERKELTHQMSNLLMEKALASHQRALLHYKNAQNAKTASSKNNHLKSARTYICRSYFPAISALILDTCYIVSPRVANYTSFKVYDSVLERCPEYPSITYLRNTGRFEMISPLHGPSLLDPDENTRYLKNSDSAEAVPIDLVLPERLTGMYKKFLSIRDDYIKIEIEDQIPSMIIKVKQSINEITDSNKEDSNFYELRELRKDLDVLLNFSLENLDMFLPFRSIRYSSFPGERKFEISELIQSDRAHRRHFYLNPQALGEYFKNCTCAVLTELAPELQSKGINIHSLRHLSATTHLELNKGDYIGAAAILNDNIEQIVKVYGTKNRSQAMRELGNEERGAQ